MFQGCSSLQSLTCYYNANELDSVTTISNPFNALFYDWLPNNTATFYKSKDVTNWPANSNTIPSTWTIKDIE